MAFRHSWTRRLRSSRSTCAHVDCSLAANSTALRAIAADLPADRILVETDAPYLAPLPFRGKRNEPAYVVETAKVLADARGVPLDEIAQQTSNNFFRLFGKVPRPAQAAA